MNIDWKKMNDLVPTIVQDAITGRVLMLGYMNSEALQKTQDTGLVWLYSRSRKRLWQKGEQSGNVLNVDSMTSDCDNDTILIRAIPTGPTCHTGMMTCFDNQPATMLDVLEQVIQQRQLSGQLSSSSNSYINSYTKTLLNAGILTINAKITEEATEVAQALAQESDQRVIEESADVLYHLMVGLKARDIRFEEVLVELHRRSR